MLPGPDGGLARVVGVAAGPAVGVGRVTVAKIQPAGPLVGKHSVCLGEGASQILDVRLGRGFLAVLAFAVVPETPIGRTGDDAVHRPSFDALQAEQQGLHYLQVGPHPWPSRPGPERFARVWYFPIIGAGKDVKGAGRESRSS